MDKDLSVMGLLISRPTGIVFCKYEMPTVVVEDCLITPGVAKLQMQLDANPVLQKDVCTSLQYLLKDN